MNGWNPELPKGSEIRCSGNMWHPSWLNQNNNWEPVICRSIIVMKRLYFMILLTQLLSYWAPRTIALGWFCKWHGNQSLWCFYMIHWCNWKWWYSVCERVCSASGVFVPNDLDTYFLSRITDMASNIIFEIPLFNRVWLADQLESFVDVFITNESRA